jgi:hypothetical protein
MQLHYPWVLIAALIVLLSVSASADEQNVENTADVRCVIVGIRLVQSGNSQQQLAGQLAAMYYVGRLDGRTPRWDAEAAISSEVGRMTPADYAADARRCGTELIVKGQQMAEWGKKLVEQGKKLQDKAAKPTT